MDVVTARQVITDYTLRKKKPRTISVRHIVTHFPQCLSSTGTANPIYDHYTPPFFEMK